MWGSNGYPNGCIRLVFYFFRIKNSLQNNANKIKSPFEKESLKVGSNDVDPNV